MISITPTMDIQNVQTREGVLKNPGSSPEALLFQKIFRKATENEALSPEENPSSQKEKGLDIPLSHEIEKTSDEKEEPKVEPNPFLGLVQPESALKKIATENPHLVKEKAEVLTNDLQTREQVLVKPQMPKHRERMREVQEGSILISPKENMMDLNREAPQIKKNQEVVRSLDLNFIEPSSTTLELDGVEKGVQKPMEGSVTPTLIPPSHLATEDEVLKIPLEENSSDLLPKDSLAPQVSLGEPFTPVKPGGEYKDQGIKEVSYPDSMKGSSGVPKGTEKEILMKQTSTEKMSKPLEKVDSMGTEKLESAQVLGRDPLPPLHLQVNLKPVETSLPKHAPVPVVLEKKPENILEENRISVTPIKEELKTIMTTMGSKEDHSKVENPLPLSQGERPEKILGQEKEVNPLFGKYKEDMILPLKETQVKETQVKDTPVQGIQIKETQAQEISEKTQIFNHDLQTKEPVQVKPQVLENIQKISMGKEGPDLKTPHEKPLARNWEASNLAKNPVMETLPKAGYLGVEEGKSQDIDENPVKTPMKPTLMEKTQGNLPEEAIIIPRAQLKSMVPTRSVKVEGECKDQETLEVEFPAILKENGEIPLKSEKIILPQNKDLDEFFSRQEDVGQKKITKTEDRDLRLRDHLPPVKVEVMPSLKEKIFPKSAPVLVPFEKKLDKATKDLMSPVITWKEEIQPGDVNTKVIQTEVPVFEGPQSGSKLSEKIKINEGKETPDLQGPKEMSRINTEAPDVKKNQEMKSSSDVGLRVVSPHVSTLNPEEKVDEKPRETPMKPSGLTPLRNNPEDKAPHNPRTFADVKGTQEASSSDSSVKVSLDQTSSLREEFSPVKRQRGVKDQETKEVNFQNVINGTSPIQEGPEKKVLSQKTVFDRLSSGLEDIDLKEMEKPENRDFGPRDQLPPMEVQVRHTFGDKNFPKSDQAPLAFEKNLEKATEEIMTRVTTLKEGRETTMTLKLYPEDLGEMEISLNLREGKVSGKILIDHKEIRELFMKNMEDLTHTLKENKVQVLKFEVGDFSQSHHREGRQDPQQNGFLRKSPHFYGKNEDHVREQSPYPSKTSPKGLNILA